MAASMERSGKQFVAQLRDKDSVQSVFLVSEKALLKDKNGKAYLSLSLRDTSGWINARVWDKADEFAATFELGDFVRIKGHVQMHQGRVQVVVHDLARVKSDEISLGDFVSQSQRAPEAMLSELQTMVKTVESPYIRELLTLTLDEPDIRERLLRAPAAKTIHHAYMGGLLEHILSMTQLLDGMAAHYSYLNRDLLIFGAIYHDLGKIWELSSAEGIQYTDKGRLIGHMVLAVETIERLSSRISAVPERLKDVLKHIILSHHGKIEYGSPKEPCLPEALLIAMVDELDSRLNTLYTFLIDESKSQTGSWTRLNSHFGRYFFLEMFRERITELRDDSATIKSTNSAF